MKKFEEVVEVIRNTPLADGMSVKVVAIDGHGGAGKSTLADKLAQELQAEIVRTDYFASWDDPLDWWTRVVDEILKPIKNHAKTLNYELSSWAPDHNPESVKDQPVTPVMILEGVGSARQEFRSYLTYTIWVETPIDVCLKRGLQRDGQEALPKWQKWIAEESKYIARDDPKDYANVVVSGEREDI